MTTKFYQINGVWNTYQYWHDNYGYTIEPTQSMNFKSSASGTWGTSVNPGYFASPGGYTIDNWSFWSEGIVGWKDIDELALAGAYPATAIDILLERNGSIANAVYVDDSDELYYLIDGYLSDGWRPWNEVEADGWQVYEGAPPYYMVVNETTGEIVYSISETEENPSMVFSQVGHIEMPDSEMITVYETGVPVQSFYFTTNGRSETENTDISHADIPVYNEDGTAPPADTPYADASVLAFMDVTGNTKQAQGEGLYINDGVLRLDAPDTDEGEQWAALVEYIPEVVLKVKWGDTVNVPSGYKAVEVRTFVGYAPVGYFGDFSGGGKVVSYGKINEYFDNIPNHNLIIGSTVGALDSAWPLLVASQGYQLNNTAGPHMQVYDFGAGYKNTTSYWSLSGFMTNDRTDQTGEFSVYLRGPSTTNVNTAISSGYPVRLLWFIIDDQGNAVWHKTPEAFRVPNSLWSFVNGVFSWLGNSEDTSSLAWYYKHDWELFEWEEFDGVWFYVHCIHDPTPEPPAPSELTAYFTNQGSAGTANTSMSSSQSYQLYDASGNALSFDLTKKYTINKYYNISGTEKSVGAYAKCIDVMGNLYLRPNASPTIFRAELSLSPQTTIEAYFTANGSSETTDTYCGSTKTKTLYDASGVPIPYESTKTYTTVASFVVNGDTAYTDFEGNFAAWSDTVLKGRGTNNYYYKIFIRVE